MSIALLVVPFILVALLEHSELAVNSRVFHENTFSTKKMAEQLPLPHLLFMNQNQNFEPYLFRHFNYTQLTL